MSNFKKTVSLGVILAMSALVSAPNANALVGVLLVNAPLAIAGAAVATGAAALEGAAYYSAGPEDAGISAALAAIFTIPAGALGLILLDGKSGQTVVYKAIDAKEAAQLGLSAEESDSYNSHLLEINLVLQSVENDLGEIKNPTIQDSQQAWDKYSSALPAPAMTAAGKISALAAQSTKN